MSGEEGKGRNSRPQSTGGVNRKADPRGGSSRGGVDASDHSGWSSENNPWGGSSSSGVHWGGGSGKGNNSGQGGNLSSGVSLTLFPEAQASAAFGAPVNISLIDGMWGFSVFRASPVQEAVAAALAKLEQGLVSALPYVGRLVGVVFGLLIPSSIAPDDKSMMSQIVTTLPAVRVTDTPVSTLPTQPGTITVHTRITDIVQDEKQYLAVVGGIPANVPVVDAKPTARAGVFTAAVVPGMPDIHIRTETGTPTAASLAKGVTPENADARPVGFTSGGNSHEAIIRFPKESGQEPIYVSVTHPLTPGQLKQRQEEENRLQQAWNNAHPVRAAREVEYLAGVALDSARQAETRLREAVELLKNTPTGLTL
ncbi:colicin-like bacteriocin tRNase domain-containing protein, partial [Yersinia enterocolitica]